MPVWAHSTCILLVNTIIVNMYILHISNKAMWKVWFGRFCAFGRNKWKYSFCHIFWSKCPFELIQRVYYLSTQSLWTCTYFIYPIKPCGRSDLAVFVLLVETNENIHFVISFDLNARLSSFNVYITCQHNHCEHVHTSYIQ